MKMFSEIAGLSVRMRIATEADAQAHDQIDIDDILICRVDTGEIIAVVPNDRLYDADGNLFDIQR